MSNSRGSLQWPHFQDTWEELSETQQVQLLDETQKKGNQQREFSELSESKLFRQFVRSTCRARFFQMTVSELEEVLEKIDDKATLGKSDLRFMEAVSQQLERRTLPTVIEKGMVIREVLNEALASLHGVGLRTDASPDWAHYNILYYRYFKYHLKNELIAARLGFSKSKYYHERKKAIKAFLNVLFDVERASTIDDD